MDKKYNPAEIRPETNGDFFNHRWIEYHATNAYRIGRTVVNGVEKGRICSSREIVKAIVPVYRKMNMAWNGHCCTETINLRKIPDVLVWEWSQMPLDFWNYEFLISEKYGMVKKEKRKAHDRKLPAFLLESLLQDLNEGLGDLGNIKQVSNDFIQTRISLAHSYRHLNFAVNSAISMTINDFRHLNNPENKIMGIFDDFSRWPEAVVKELGPNWVIDLQERLKFK